MPNSSLNTIIWRLGIFRTLLVRTLRFSVVFLTPKKVFIVHYRQHCTVNKAVMLSALFDYQSCVSMQLCLQYPVTIVFHGQNIKLSTRKMFLPFSETCLALRQKRQELRAKHQHSRQQGKEERRQRSLLQSKSIARVYQYYKTINQALGVNLVGQLTFFQATLQLLDYRREGTVFVVMEKVEVQYRDRPNTNPTIYLKDHILYINGDFCKRFCTCIRIIEMMFSRGRQYGGAI